MKEEEPPGGTDSGKVNPEAMNPVPESEACVTLSVAVPGFLMVSVWELVTPTVTLPKLTLEGMMEICACAPVPLRVIATGEFVALLTTVTLPERLPVEAGAKVTLKVVDCPAARLSGNAIPVTLKPAPLALTCEMETLEFPVFFSVTVCAVLVPVVRLPKLSDVGFGDSCKADATPDPLRGILKAGFVALFVSVRLPERVPAEFGVKPTLNDAEPPGATESGKINPGKLNPAGLKDAWVTLRVPEPGFCTVIVCVLVTPTLTFPKAMLEGTTVIRGFTPVPLTGIVAGELVAVLTRLTLPETLPAAVGAKLAVSGRLWPAARVAAPEKPLRLNPAPVMVT